MPGFILPDDDDVFASPAPVVQPQQPAPPPAAPAPTTLVVSSLAAAKDGSYQSLVTALSANGPVDMQMIDRITDSG